MRRDEGGFVSLADILRSRPPAFPSAQPEPAVTECVPVVVLAPEVRPAAARDDLPDGAAALRAARLFRAGLADAFDALTADLVRALAREVLGRELRLSPVDIEGIARQLIEQCFDQEPLRLRVAPADAGVACDLPVAADSELEPGDAILECRSGDIDARLRVRLASVLAKVEP